MPSFFYIKEKTMSNRVYILKTHDHAYRVMQTEATPTKENIEAIFYRAPVFHSLAPAIRYAYTLDNAYTRITE